MTSPTPDPLYPQITPITQKDAAGQDFEASVATLTSRVDELVAENGDLKRASDRASEEVAELQSKLTKLTQERDDLSRQRQTNLLKIRRLNDMIIKGVENSDEPIDDSILQDMYEVRNKATDVIRGFFPGDALFKPDVGKSLTKRLGDHFYTSYYREQIQPDKNPERRRRLLIALMFTELRFQFFGAEARRFGLPGHMEAGLKDFEKLIEESTKGRGFSSSGD